MTILASPGLTPGSGLGIAASTSDSATAAVASQATRRSSAVNLKSLTGGQGSYTIEFARYAAVPSNVQQQMASKFQLHEDDE